MENTERLNGKEWTSLVAESCLQLIPYIGGSLATLYFGAREEKRFKRLESFYKELAETVNQLKIEFPDISNFNQEELIFLIEELNEKVEREISENKLRHFKKYLLSTLTQTDQQNFEEQKHFLYTLSEMNLLDFEVMSYLSQNNSPVILDKIPNTANDVYALVGAVNKLRNFGFLELPRINFMWSGDKKEHSVQNVNITSFGLKFSQYCIQYN
ncbi:hypothetical protein R70723_06630 [Paenibacillus sp. FSL R7-0273]|uniref:hypothetical protein n=1 Tax=Paenibacillus sp. FSL R7-0273 TaxID=1536772 RepID=UPI0004F703DE|nr:hypothetical protein [Paenibacillus sp. FSL R7-0273]AIQ45607.1 hypothetical protein R70723_06630 [Paenibacillus sp. FSL R7-0273]OMF95124.1 hypothetical protein BK144_06200 [Paenibacillus sp. FSL R7-0273]